MERDSRLIIKRLEGACLDQGIACQVPQGQANADRPASEEGLARRYRAFDREDGRLAMTLRADKEMPQ
jgi:hypothetical protein